MCKSGEGGVMHSFSVAVLLRKMIELFFLIIQEKGLEWLQNTMNLCIKKILSFLNKTGSFFKDTENMVHMFGKEQVVEEIIMIFSRNYTLLGVERV